MTVPHPFLDLIAARVYTAASRTPAPKNSKDKNKDNPGTDTTPEPSESPSGTGGGGEESDPFGSILDFLIANPWIPGILVAIVGINIGWKKLTERQNLNGQPLAPLGSIVSRSLRLAFKEDKTPVFMRPQKFAIKMRWLTWQRYWLIALAAALFDISAFSGIIPDQYEIVFTVLIVAMILGGVQHMRLVFQRRHRILMQMFEVAAAECKYPKGAELNPWGWIQVTKWNGLYSPASTYVVFPPRFRSEDEGIQQAFERNFNGTVSSEHTWMYTWESANNRVLCEPVPFITDNAPYPFPDEHPWNEFPLGIAAGGKEAVWDVSTFPHSLVAGTTGSGKSQNINTRIPVPISDIHPTGWTTFGDIEVGDTVFDEHGRPCRVTGVSEIRDDSDMYRVHFSDGTYIDSSGDHMWFTHTRRTRQSGWNARRKQVERRSLVSPEGRAALEALLSAQTNSTEVTIREVAEAAGVHETSPWLLEVAAHLGHVGETQAVVDFHYAEQTVLQKQKMAVYDAQEAWGALARYRDNARIPAWYAARGECATLAAEATDTDTITSRDVGRVLGMTPQKAGAMLRHKGVESWVTKAGPGRAVAVFPARTTWTILAESQPQGAVSPWKQKRTLFQERFASSAPGEQITATDIAAAVGVSATDVRGMLKRLGVACVVEKREVLLQVPQKVVRRKTMPARTYLGREFIRAVLERVETPAHDQRHKRDYGAVRTTLDILETLRTRHGHANHSIPVAQPLELPSTALPIDPYLLGVWLGDGHPSSGKFSGVDHEIADHLHSSGEVVRAHWRPLFAEEGRHPDFREWRVKGLTTALRDMDLLQRTTEEGSRKRIPAIYLRASIAQRRALLAGLLDTDGTVAKQGTTQFDNSNEVLAYQTLELARSLGYRATITQKRATLDGVDYGPTYRVSFACAESPFRLSRKTEEFAQRTKNHNPEKTSRRYITDIQRIPAVPARCIMVDSPSRLFLAGDAMIPTHNSVTQRTILLHALQSPDWRVSLIDPKRVELSAYTSHRNVVKVATELDESVALLEGVEQEMQSRYKRMEKEGVNHFKRLSTSPPALLLMVDELFALLSPENIRSDEGKERDELHARATVVIGSIARLGRAAGIHMILATQRPDAKVLPGETKALALDTPILTPNGWSTVERLQPGDEVFAPDGTPTLVTAVTDVMHDHVCYEVEFSDGSTIVADAGHLWVTGNAAAPTTTADIAALLSDADRPPLLHVQQGGVEGMIPAGESQPSGFVDITNARQVPSVPVKCIAVEHPSRQFLAGRTLIATHNSNLDCRIAQGRMDTTPSLMVLDSEAATRIPKIKGRAMVRQGGEITEFQAYFLPEESLMQVLEMSEALASQQMTVQDFKDLIEQARAEAGGKAPGKSRIPKIPVPKGLASKTTSWVERRKQAVERNEEEGRRFAAQKSKSASPMKDLPAEVEPPGRGGKPGSPGAFGGEDPGRGGRRGRRGGGEPVGPSRGVVEPAEGYSEAWGEPGEPGMPGAAVGASEARGSAREVPHERAGLGGAGLVGEFDVEEFDAEKGFEFLDDVEDVPGLDDPRGLGDGDYAEGLDLAAGGEPLGARGVGVEPLDDEDYLPPWAGGDFLDDVRDESVPPRVVVERPVAPEVPLPGVPRRAERLEAPGVAGVAADVGLPEASPSAADAFAEVLAMPSEGVARLAVEDEDDEDFVEEAEEFAEGVVAEDFFGAVAEAPWMPEDVGGASRGPSPFGGVEYVPPPSAPVVRPRVEELREDEEDDEAPFI